MSATPDPSTPREVVFAFLEAFEDRDFERALGLLSPEGFRYDGPIDHFTDPRAFIEDITSIGQILERIERRRVFTDAGDVCVICTLWTTVDEIEHTRLAIWFEVRNGHICRIESFLDVRAYSRMFDPER